jgi:hypothetical protein
MKCLDCQKNTGHYNVKDCHGCYERITLASAKIFTSKVWQERYIKYCMDNELKRVLSFDEVVDNEMKREVENG